MNDKALFWHLCLYLTFDPVLSFSYTKKANQPKIILVSSKDNQLLSQNQPLNSCQQGQPNQQSLTTIELTAQPNIEIAIHKWTKDTISMAYITYFRSDFDM